MDGSQRSCEGQPTHRPLIRTTARRGRTHRPFFHRPVATPPGFTFRLIATSEPGLTDGTTRLTGEAIVTSGEKPSADRDETGSLLFASICTAHRAVRVPPGLWEEPEVRPVGSLYTRRYTGVAHYHIVFRKAKGSLGFGLSGNYFRVRARVSCCQSRIVVTSQKSCRPCWQSD